MDREKIIIRTSMIGIATNVLLSAFKAFVGIASNSIAIVMDAVNNISDALSSVITIVGTKLAGREPDKKHPYGHGRIEYLSAMIISAIVLYAGITSLVESVKKIISPQIPDYSTASLIIVAVAVVAKIVLGTFVKKQGEKVNSESLVDSGKDAQMDSVISFSTLAAALIYIKTGLSLEAFLGAAISLVIIKSGIEMLRSTLSQILGERIESDLAKEIKKTVASFPPVHGAYDLILNNYGPDIYMGSVHIEVPQDITATQLDKLTRDITHRVFEKHGVVLAAVGIYSINTKDEASVNAKKAVEEIVYSYSDVLQMHGFYYSETDRLMSFDIVIDFARKDRHKIYNEIFDKIKQLYPDVSLAVNLDLDISD
jgi:cation diffusion facilitator family transporter